MCFSHGFGSRTRGSCSTSCTACEGSLSWPGCRSPGSLFLPPRPRLRASPPTQPISTTSDHHRRRRRRRGWAPLLTSKDLAAGEDAHVDASRDDGDGGAGPAGSIAQTLGGRTKRRRFCCCTRIGSPLVESRCFGCCCCFLALLLLLLMRITPPLFWT